MLDRLFTEGPTPLGTLLISLALVSATALIFWASRKLVGTQKKGVGWFDRLLRGLRSADRRLVSYGSIIAGTAIANARLRRVAVPVELTAIATISVVIPGPYGLFILALGLLGILIIFRHWSRDEDTLQNLAEMARSPTPKDREVPIEGDLSIEVLIACSFIFVFACVAFAQIANAGLGFQLKPGAGAFAFVLYSLVELLKVGALVHYYDLFSHRLPFDNASEVHQLGLLASSAVLTYRTAVNLLLVVVIVRLVEIASRKGDGRDLREVRAMLDSRDSKLRALAIADLENYALRLGRPSAAMELEQAADPVRGLLPEERLNVAVVLQKYAEDYGSSTPLYAAVIILRQLHEQDFPERSEWLAVRIELGTALEGLGSREGNDARLKESAEILTAATSALASMLAGATNPDERRRLSLQLGQAQNQLGNTLREIAHRTHGADQISEPDEKERKYVEAERAFRSALETFGKEGYWQSYVKVGANIGNILIRRSKRKPHTLDIQDAIKFYEIVLKFVRKNMGLSAGVQAGLGHSLCELAEREPGSDDYLLRALEAYRKAAADFRATQEAESGASGNERLLDWARIQIGLGRALHMLGHRQHDSERLYEARAAIKEAIEMLRGRNVGSTEAEAWKHYEKVEESL